MYMYIMSMYMHAMSRKRLEGILRSLSTKKLSKPVVLVRSKLDLKFQPQFSDLSLISEDGETIPCHRCVLVARSGMYAFIFIVCLYLLICHVHVLYMHVYSKYAFVANQTIFVFCPIQNISGACY